MAGVNLSGDPYFCNFDVNKGYTRVLGRPGRVYQSREVNEAQEIQDEYLGRIGKVVCNEGGVVSGCSSMTYTDAGVMKVRILEGLVFFSGKVRNVYEAEFTIVGIGEEYIFVDLVREIITAYQDSTLFDPALTENFGSVGADRLKETLAYVYKTRDEALAEERNLESAIVKIVDGTIIRRLGDSTNADTVNMLARRTYDESGHYKLKGLDIVHKEVPGSVNNPSATQHRFAATMGKAYIKGYEFETYGDTMFYLDDTTDYRLVTAESYTATEQFAYRFNKQFPKALNRVVYTQRATTQIQHGALNSIDSIPGINILSINSLIKGEVTYIENTDFSLIDGTISWALAGNEPAPGEQYTLDYNYRRTLTATGVKLSVPEISVGVLVVKNFDGSDSVEVDDPDRGYVVFDLAGGFIPVIGTTIDIDYEYYLSRRDLILLDKGGEVEIVRGVPDDIDLCGVPYLSSSDKIRLGEVFLYPTQRYNIRNYSNRRVTMDEVHMILDRVKDLEYNIAVTDLDREAEMSASATDLKGILTDGFIGTTKMDITHPEFDCAVDAYEGYLTTYREVDYESLVFGAGSTARKSTNNVITAPYTEVVHLSQSLVSGFMKVNPYQVYDKIVELKLSPAVDKWTETVRYSTEKTTSKVIYQRISHATLRAMGGVAHENNLLFKWERLTPAERASIGYYGPHSGMVSQFNAVERVYTGTTSTMNSRAIYYMRAQSVTLTGSNFVSNLDNIECKFSGKRIGLVAVAPSSTGTLAGSIKASSTGVVSARFTVPTDIPCGSVAVDLEVGGQVLGSAIYTAYGQEDTYQDTYHYNLNELAYVYIDPVAQTFVADNDMMLSSVGLFFAEKDTTAPLYVQIREVSNGVPTKTVMGQVKVASASVNVSGDASIETRVIFSEPVFCEKDKEYAVTVISDSPEYSIWYAELGKNKLGTTVPIVGNPYTNGVLLSSSNGTSWTIHQGSDLKFKLYRCNFTEESSVIFNSILKAPLTYSGFGLLVSSYVPSNCAVEYEYALGAETLESSAKPFFRDQLVDFTDPQSVFKVRARIKATPWVSPILYGDNQSLVLEDRKISGAYVTRNIKFDSTDKYKAIKVIVDMVVPAGCSVSAQYLKDVLDANSWTIIPAEIPPLAYLDGEYSTYFFTKDVTVEAGDEAGLADFKFKMGMVATSKVDNIKIKKLRIILEDSPIP